MFFANGNSEQGATNEVFASDSETTIVMEIDNPVMSVNGQDVEIDPGYGTAPLIVDGRTLTNAVNPIDRAEMLREMATSGTAMALLVTGVWAAMVIGSSAIEKRAAKDEAVNQE